MRAAATRWRILPASDAHAHLLAELHARAFEVPWSAASLAELMAMPRTFALLAHGATSTDEPVHPAGFILCRVAAEECEVLTIAVDVATRERGVAKALLDAASTEAADRGANAIYLEVAINNAPARRLYAAAGFFPVGRRQSYYQSAKDRPSTDALVLMCPLNRSSSTKA